MCLCLCGCSIDKNENNYNLLPFDIKKPINSVEIKDEVKNVDKVIVEK